MLRMKSLAALLAGSFFVGIGAAYAGDQNGPMVRIDIPVKLEKANVVFDVGNLVLNGDIPFALGDMAILADDLSQSNAKGEVIAVFHGNAAYLVLNDGAFDADRSKKTGHPSSFGNPFKKLIAGLMERGFQIELCGATAIANHWANEDLLPGVKVNTDAMVRVTQLEQQGFTLIYQ